MAKLIRFPLQLADGTGARSLEELREHGDVESVLKHYREGTLARWLKAFRYDELAERVAEHRNAQLEGSKANLQEVFPLLGIPLEEAAFAEYCEKKLSKGFVFSDANGGDLKTYGQGVSIKDKLVEFLPEGKLPGGDSLEDWEVTEAELDGGLVQVVCASEQHNFSSSLQMEKGEDLYQRVYQMLRACMDMPKYRPKVTVAIGKRGPGGGLVFHIDGPKAYEVSEMLGKHQWAEAKKMAEGYRGGGFSDWRLPTKEELNLVYQNLRKPGIITGTGDDWHWSSSQYHSTIAWAQRFGDGGQVPNSDHYEYAVRAIRSFSIEG
ncbi:MAG: DUF1566 domain-containing protein [Spirochaetaceae bacterium]|nr:DUF1566 domain-containing protein [Spirochaetaceae bacterium]